MSNISLRAVFGVIVLVMLWQVAPADLRAQVASGTILGVVRDDSGAIVPKASIACKSVETGVVRTVVTGGLGSYVIPGLPVGSYDLEASLQGFKTGVWKGVTVTVGASNTVNFTLTVGVVQESVEVTAEASQVNTTDASLGGLVGEAAIRELPLNGRDWLQLALLQAGVVGGLGQQSAASGTNSRAARGNGMGLAIHGGRPTANVFVI